MGEGPGDRRGDALTTDGVEDFGYATDNAGWTKSDRPVPVVPRLAEDRHVPARRAGRGHDVPGEHGGGAPELQAWKYPMPEDSVIFRIPRVVVDLDGPRVVRLKMPPDPHRSTVCDHVLCGGTFADVEWGPESRQLAFVSSSRDHKDATLRVADAATGDVRDVLAEHAETFFESGYNMANWHVLPRTRRGDLVFGAGRLGPPVPLRPGHRDAEAPHHQGELERAAAPARRRGQPHALLHRRRQGAGRPVLPVPLQREHGRG